MPQIVAKPHYALMLKYARGAVRDEFANPHHGRLSGYENQAVLDTVLNHFEALEVEEDEDIIREVVREAEQLEYPERDL